MTTPIALTDEQLAAIIRAARPLDVHVRDSFLQEVAAMLANGGGPVGDGDVHRAIRATQRKYFDPPIEVESPHHRGKYA